jgi:hypothetical protein
MIIIVNILLLSSCEYFAEHRYSLRILNASNETLYCCAVYVLPDTLLPENRPDEFKILNPLYESELRDYEVRNRKFKRLQNERLSLFILSKDSVDLLSWSYIRKSNLILKRYEFDMREYSEMGGIIVYPN